jgi:hypothetical protein
MNETSGVGCKRARLLCGVEALQERRLTLIKTAEAVKAKVEKLIDLQLPPRSGCKLKGLSPWATRLGAAGILGWSTADIFFVAGLRRVYL